MIFAGHTGLVHVGALVPFEHKLCRPRLSCAHMQSGKCLCRLFPRQLWIVNTTSHVMTRLHVCVHWYGSSMFTYDVTKDFEFLGVELSFKFADLVKIDQSA